MPEATVTTSMNNGTASPKPSFKPRPSDDDDDVGLELGGTLLEEEVGCDDDGGDVRLGLGGVVLDEEVVCDGDDDASTSEG